MHIQVGMARNSCKPSKWSGRKSSEIREASVGRHFQESVIHGGAVENISCRNDIFGGKQPTSLSQFRRNLGKPSCDAKRPSYWPPFRPPVPEQEERVNPWASHVKHRKNGFKSSGSVG